jgi:hypothetical protein
VHRAAAVAKAGRVLEADECAVERGHAAKNAECDCAVARGFEEKGHAVIARRWRISPRRRAGPRNEQDRLGAG